MNFLMIGEYAINLDNVAHVHFASEAAGSPSRTEEARETIARRLVAEVTVVGVASGPVAPALRFFDEQAEQLRRYITTHRA